MLLGIRPYVFAADLNGEISSLFFALAYIEVAGICFGIARTQTFGDGRCRQKIFQRGIGPQYEITFLRVERNRIDAVGMDARGMKKHHGKEHSAERGQFD